MKKKRSYGISKRGNLQKLRPVFIPQQFFNDVKTLENDILPLQDLRERSIIPIKT
jgi:hypothetical protein